MIINDATAVTNIYKNYAVIYYRIPQIIWMKSSNDTESFYNDHSADSLSTL